MNHENLIDLTKRVQREKREIQSKGGRASAKKRKEKKSMRDMFEILLGSDAKDKKDLEKLKRYGKEKSNQMLAAVSIFELVKEKGSKSVDAFKAMMELMGENSGQNNDENDSFNNLIGAIKYARACSHKKRIKDQS